MSVYIFYFIASTITTQSYADMRGIHSTGCQCGLDELIPSYQLDTQDYPGNEAISNDSAVLQKSSSNCIAGDQNTRATYESIVCWYRKIFHQHHITNNHQHLHHHNIQNHQHNYHYDHHQHRTRLHYNRHHYQHHNHIATSTATTTNTITIIITIMDIIIVIITIIISSSPLS